MELQEFDSEAVLEEVKFFLPRLIQACNEVEQLFYEPMTEQGWQQFGEIVEGMDDLYKTLNAIQTEMQKTNGNNGLKPVIDNVLNELILKFQAMNQCVDDDDFIGASDYIKYELTPLFQQLFIELGAEIGVMKQLFKANMTFLEQNYPKVYEQIHSLAVDDQRYQVVVAKNGLPNLFISENNGVPSYLYSQYDPSYEAERWVNNLASKVEDKHNIMIYGFGFGYHAQKYVEAYPDHRLSIYEPNEQVLLAAMSVIDLSKFFNRENKVDFVVGEKKDDRDRMFYRFLKYMKGEPVVIAIPVYDKLKGLDKELFSNDAQYAIMNYYSSIRMYNNYGEEWATNSMYNLATNLTTPSIIGLKDKLKGMTAVIVGAGPSLEADIEYLRELKDHTFIIAAGTTIQSLLHFGIDPHLVVSMDGSEANYNAFKDLDIEHIPLLYAPMVKYRIIDEKKGHLFHVHLNNDAVTRHLMKLTSDDAIFETNHSVTGTAIQAAIYMGCEEIIFTGQDLSFPIDNLYAPGARHFSKEAIHSLISGAELTVENVSGTLNRTNGGMKTTLADIEDLLVKYPTIRFFNTSGLGAKIKGTQWQSMKDVLARLQHTSFDHDFFIKRMESLSLQKYDDLRIQAIRERVLQLPEQMLLYVERLKHIDGNIENVFSLSRTNPKKCLHTFEEINKEWKLIVDSNPFQSLYLMLFRNELNDFERDLPELFHESNLIKKSKLIREVMQPLVRKMIDRSPAIIEIVNEARRRIEVSMI